MQYVHAYVYMHAYLYNTHAYTHAHIRTYTHIPLTMCSNNKARQGYMGHLLKIVNCLAMSGDADEQLRELLKTTLSKEMFSRWNDFLNGPVADQNKKNETNLVSFSTEVMCVGFEANYFIVVRAQYENVPKILLRSHLSVL